MYKVVGGYNGTRTWIFEDKYEDDDNDHDDDDDEEEGDHNAEDLTI